MIVGVTGGSGFIGSYVCDELIKRGHTPFVLDHKGRVEHGLLGDVRDATIVMELAAHVDAIIHLAAVLGTSETIDAPHAAAETNIIGTINIFESATRYGIPVVFAAVGNANIGRGTYCITKSCGERFVNMYREDRGLQVASIRPMNAYGPRQSVPAPYGSAKVRKIVPSFICSALAKIRCVCMVEEHRSATLYLLVMLQMYLLQHLNDCLMDLPQITRLM
jgi:UDP-glucose 4-epimerase